MIWIQLTCCLKLNLIMHECSCLCWQETINIYYKIYISATFFSDYLVKSRILFMAHCFDGATLIDHWGGAVVHAGCLLCVHLVDIYRNCNHTKQKYFKEHFNTDPGSHSFAQVNGILKPLLSSGGRRVNRTGPQVRTDWRRGPSGRRLGRPGGLGTLLLGNGVLKHTLINCGGKDGD